MVRDDYYSKMAITDAIIDVLSQHETFERTLQRVLARHRDLARNRVAGADVLELHAMHAALGRLIDALERGEEHSPC